MLILTDHYDLEKSSSQNLIGLLMFDEIVIKIF